MTNIKRPLLLTIFSLFILSYASQSIANEPVDALIKDLEDRLNNPLLIDVNFSDAEYQRNEKSKELIKLYRIHTTSFRYLIPQFIRTIFDDRIDKEISNIKNLRAFNINELHNKIKEYKKNNGTLKTGDLVFISSLTPYALASKKFLDVPYSHTGLIWIKDSKPYIIQVHPSADLIVLPLVDFLLPLYPKNRAFALLRFKGDNQHLEYEYLFNKLLEKKHHILFDEYFVNNPEIKTPETYFKNPRYFYCTEFPYLIYSFVYKNPNILAPFSFKTKDILSQFVDVSPIYHGLLDFIDQETTKNNRFIIVPQHFTQSNHFELLIEYSLD